MNWNKVKLGIGLALIYWIPATVVLYNIIYGTGGLFSEDINIFLRPGYFIGLVLGLAGGNGFAILGQLITLFILTVFILQVIYLFNRKNSASNKAGK